MGEPIKCQLVAIRKATDAECETAREPWKVQRSRRLHYLEFDLCTNGPFVEPTDDVFRQDAWLTFGDKPTTKVGGFDDVTAADITGSKGS